jgi:hypothetical protein
VGGGGSLIGSSSSDSARDAGREDTSVQLYDKAMNFLDFKLSEDFVCLVRSGVLCRRREGGGYACRAKKSGKGSGTFLASPILRSRSYNSLAMVSDI